MTTHLATFTMADQCYALMQEVDHPPIKTSQSVHDAGGWIPSVTNQTNFETNMSEHIKNVSDGTFDQDVLKSDQPVLVDYWAAWCGPCKMIAPILEEVASEYAGKLTIAKVNVDENQETAAKFGIRGIPTLMLFKNGQVSATKVGALSKSQLTAFLDGAL